MALFLQARREHEGRLPPDIEGRLLLVPWGHRLVLWALQAKGDHHPQVLMAGAVECHLLTREMLRIEGRRHQTLHKISTNTHQGPRHRRDAELLHPEAPCQYSTLLRQLTESRYPNVVTAFVAVMATFPSEMPAYNVNQGI